MERTVAAADNQDEVKMATLVGSQVEVEIATLADTQHNDGERAVAAADTQDEGVERVNAGMADVERAAAAAAASVPPCRWTRLLPTHPSYSLGVPKYSPTGPSYYPTPPMKDKRKHTSYTDAAEVTWSVYDISFVQNTTGGGGGVEVTRLAGVIHSTRDHILWCCTRSATTHRAPRRTGLPSLAMPTPQPERPLRRSTWKGLLQTRPTGRGSLRRPSWFRSPLAADAQDEAKMAAVGSQDEVKTAPLANTQEVDMERAAAAAETQDHVVESAAVKSDMEKAAAATGTQDEVEVVTPADTQDKAEARASEKAMGERAVAIADVVRATQDGVEMARVGVSQNVVGRVSTAESGIGRDWSGPVWTCWDLNIVMVT